MINSHSSCPSSSHNPSVVSSCSLGTGSPASTTYNLDPTSVASNANVQNHLSSSSRSHIYIFHLNVRSLAPHFTNIVDLLNSHNFNIVALSETWLRPHDDSSCFFMPGYTLIRSDCVSEILSRGGGVAFYINSNLRYEVMCHGVPDSYHCDNRLGVLGICITISHIRLTVFVVYTPPSCAPAVLIPFESFLHDFTTASNFTICMADFNVDLNNALPPGLTYINNILNTLSLKQIINDTTRVTLDRCSLLDLIMVNNKLVIFSSGSLDVNEISDHCLVYAKLDLRKPCSGQCFLLRRNLKNLSFDDFSAAVGRLSWDEVYSSTTVDAKLASFTDSFIDIFDMYAPTELVRVTKLPAPSITPNVKLLMSLRNKVLTKE